MFDGRDDTTSCQVDSIESIHQKGVFDKSERPPVGVTQYGNIHGEEIIRFFSDRVPISPELRGSRP